MRPRQCCRLSGQAPDLSKGGVGIYRRIDDVIEGQFCIRKVEAIIRRRKHLTGHIGGLVLT